MGGVARLLRHFFCYHPFAQVEGLFVDEALEEESLVLGGDGESV